MIKIIDKISEISLDQWSSLLEESVYKSYFQTKECYDFYESLSFFKPFIVGVTEGNNLTGLVVGYIQKDGGRLKQYLSRRAIINGGPLLAENISNEALGKLLKGVLKKLKGKAIYVESRNFSDYSKYKDVFLCCGFNYNEHLNFHIDTTTEELVEKNLGKSRKRDIKVSFRDGASVVENPTIENVREFHNILEELYKSKVKTPSYPWEFFDNLYHTNSSKFLLVRYQNKIIGGTCCVCLKGHAVYEWFACGEDGVYKNIYPSTIATYAGIKFASQNGYRLFDMMGAGKPQEGYGVRDFKAKFGGVLVEDGRFLHVLNPILFAIGKIGVNIMKKLN